MFENRITQDELIDSPDCRPETVHQGHWFMRIINQYFGGTAAIKDFIRNAWSKNASRRPLRILDIGSGSCDIPLAVIQWARSKKIHLNYTCIEREAKILDRICENPGLPFKIINCDIFDYQPDCSFDYVTASMFLHHLNDEQISRLIDRLLPVTRKGIFINDLRRCAFTYFSCCLISPTLPKDVRHDALISIKKGFNKEELTALFTLPDSTATVTPRRWGRITALLELNERNPQ